MISNIQDVSVPARVDYWEWFASYLQEKCGKSWREAKEISERFQSPNLDFHKGFRSYLIAVRDLKENSVNNYMERLNAFKSRYSLDLRYLDFEELQDTVAKMRI